MRNNDSIFLVVMSLLVASFSGACLASPNTTSLNSNIEQVKPAQETIEASNEQSQIKFSGEHAGMRFEGEFQQWQAQLTLPPALSPSIVAKFSLVSAKTGDSTYDSTLPEGDWFDVENHPQASFNSSNIVAVEGGYDVLGIFTLKGISNEVSFFLKDDEDKLISHFDIDRLSYNIGVDSDPDAEWVSRNILLSLYITK